MAMVLGKTVLLSVLVAHVLAAPKPCVEFCNYDTQSYQQQSSTYKHVQQGGSLGSQNILDSYNRPGNWTEHNQYLTDGGHGQVHEERGQFVQGPSQVKYYKKNYTSSYVAGGDSLNEYDNRMRERMLHEQWSRMVEQMRLQNQRLRHNEHLEDFTEHSEQTQTTHGTSGMGTNRVLIPVVSTSPTKNYYNSYYTNYTAIFSSYGVPMPTEMQRIESQLDTLREQLQRQHEQFSSHVSSSSTSSNSQHITELMQRLKTEMDRQFQEFLNSYGTNVQNVQITGVNHAPQRTYKHTSVEKTHEHINTGRDYDRQQVVAQRPQSNIYGTQYRREYEQQYRVGVPHQDIRTTVNHEMNTDQTHRVQQHMTGMESLSLQQAERQHETLLRDTVHNTHGHILSNPRMPGQVQHIEHQSTVYAPVRLGNHERQMQSGLQYGNSEGSSLHESYQSVHTSNTQVGQSSQMNRYGSRTSGQMVTGALDLGQIQQGADCDQSGTVQYGSRHTRMYKRDVAGHKLNMQQHAKKVVGKHDDFQQLTQQIGDSDEIFQQTSGKLEYGQQTQHSGHLTQQTEDLTQQTGGFDDYTQQTSGKLEFGQQRQYPGRHTQETEDLTQQTGGFDDYTQQTSGHLQLGQQTQHSGHLTQQTEDLTQQTGGFDDYTQQTSGKLEFDRQRQHPGQHTQQTGGFDDYTQQTSGHLELGQQTQHSGHLTQQTEDLTQQTGGFGDYTQQTSGKLEFGQQRQYPGQHTQQTEDLTQQTGGFDDYTQQTSGKLEFGQQSQEPYRHRNPGTSGNLEFSQQSQQPHQSGSFEIGSQQGGYWPQRTGDNPYAQTYDDLTVRPLGNTQETDDLTQQSGTGFHDFSQQTSQNHEFGQQSQYPYNRNPQVGNQQGLGHTQQTEDLSQQNQHQPRVPAPKPTLRRRYQRPGGYEPEQPEGGDTNIETIRRPFDVNAEPDIDDARNGQFQTGQTQVTSDYNNNNNNQGTVSSPSSYSGVKGGRRRRPNSNRYYPGTMANNADLINSETTHGLQQSSQGTVYSNYQNENPQKQTNDPSLQTTEPKVEPRILEVYSLGPYNASHSDDIFDKVTPHPSATLPPYGGSDPWDIREKPREQPTVYVVQSSPLPPETIQTTTETPIETTTTFWGKIGHKITNTFDKAKEKARDLFG